MHKYNKYVYNINGNEEKPKSKLNKRGTSHHSHFLGNTIFATNNSKSYSVHIQFIFIYCYSVHYITVLI